MTTTSTGGLADLDDLLTWQEASTAGSAIAAAVAAAAHGAGEVAANLLAAAESVVVTGAGSSYYLAISSAAVARATLHRPYLAVPLSEVLLRPSGVFVSRTASAEPVIVISRSGSTSEAVAVVEAARAAGHPTIGVTCREDSPVAQLADVTLVSPAGNERAVVMTRSFGSMLALLLRVIARLAADERLAADLGRAAECWPEALAAAARGRELGRRDWSRIVILGGGPRSGIAAEWGLKLLETSQVPTMAYEPLEFRHGPISVCEPGVLVVGLIGGDGAADEVRVLEEARRLGASTWLLAGDPSEAAHDAAEEVDFVGRDLAPDARLPLLLTPGHALALALARTRGRDPDAPRHLDQVVILEPGMTDDLRLAAFRPRAALRVPRHDVPAPRYPVIDAHNHLGAAFGGEWATRDPAGLIEALDRSGVERLVDLDGGQGDDLSREIDRWQGRWPERIAVFAGLDYETWASAPEFGESEAARLRDSVGRGARGLKVWKLLGLRARDPSGGVVAIDDARLDPLWQTAADLDIPVLIHIADPIAFFDPLDPTNERWEELHANPDWHFWPTRPADDPDAPGFPPYDELLAAFGRMVARHPKTTFVGAHVASAAEDLALVGRLLDASPNLHVDIAARLGELGRQPYTARGFFLAYADRILFGMDMAPDPDLYAIHYRWLETYDESFDYSTDEVPGQGRWQIHGIGLPDDVLRKVYRDNALRVLWR